AGAIAITGGNGGASAGAATGGLGSSVTITAGNGGNGGTTGGIGGGIFLVAGAAGTGGTPSAGIVASRGAAFLKKTTNTPLTSNGAVTYAAAALVGGLITDASTTGAVTATLATGTEICTLLPGYATGDSFLVHINNTGNQTITLAGGVGSTFVGAATIVTTAAKTLLVLVTGANTVTATVVSP
ncbi:MAG: hypothetical protein Q7O66_04020, partial [Dehalococcoidia bacterium]|nr:hypothetical protein [Dehalococcoidia bacterium]